MEARRVSLFLFSPAVPSTMGDAPAHHTEAPSVCAAGGGFVLVPNFKNDYVCNEGYNLKLLNGIAATASIFPLTSDGIAVVEVDNYTAFLAETFEVLAKFVDCHHVCSFLKAVDVELLV